jgi:hypothetical protein
MSRSDLVVCLAPSDFSPEMASHDDLLRARRAQFGDKIAELVDKAAGRFLDETGGYPNIVFVSITALTIWRNSYPKSGAGMDVWRIGNWKCRQDAALSGICARGRVVDA